MKKIGVLLLLILLFGACLASCNLRAPQVDSEGENGTDGVGDPDGGEDIPAVYTVTFDSCGGSFLNPIAQAEGLLLTAPASPTRDGYVFAGWYADAAYTTLYVFGKMPSENITLYAKWLHVTTVSFETNGGSAVSPIAKTEGSVFVVPVPPTRDGYVFAGWYADAAYTTLYVFREIPAEDITLYAKWSANPVIFFESNGGSAVAPITQPAGTVLTAPSAPTRKSAEFLGWYRDAACTDPFVFDRMPDQSITLYAKWEDEGDEDEGDVDDTFTVTFMYVDPQGNALSDKNGRSQRDYSNIEYNTEVRNSYTGSVRAFENYVIVGWNTDKAKAMAGEADANCTKNIKKNKVVYSVVREKVEKTVTLLDSKGNVFDTVQILEGSKIDATVKRPSEPGLYFKDWKFVSNDEAGKTNSTVNCIYGDCTFKAVMCAPDGTIGKVAEGSITLDAKKDPAYETSGAYLAHNNVKTVNDNKTVASGGAYANPDIKADTWMVWDGNYIYLLIEVYDNSLTFRSETYIKSGVDAWCNDAVELWYCFEQDATPTQNNTRVGLSALGDVETKGDGKYALPRSYYPYKNSDDKTTGIGGGRSTHYDEIEYAVRNAYYDALENDLAADGKDKPSYIIEFKIPAYTEGEADLDWAYKDWKTKLNGGTPTQRLTGADLEDFKRTGRLYGVDKTNDNINNYRFTSGTQLQAGNFVYFCLQINDLKISVEDLNPQAKKYLETPTLAQAKAFVAEKNGTWDDDFEFNSNIMLYEIDPMTGKLVQASTVNRFCATGSTQTVIENYLVFSLSGNEEASTKVHGFKFNFADPTEQIMLDEDGNIYTRAEIGD